MKTLKTIINFLYIMIAVACNGNDEAIYTIGLSQCAMDDWRIKMNEELTKEALLHDGVQIKISSSDRDNGKQIADIRNFIKEGVDLIVVSPNEEKAISPVIEEAFHADIPIIVADRKVSTDSYTTFIGANNYLIGSLVCEHINNILQGKGRIVEICGSMASTPASERSSGFLKNLSPDINLLCSADGNWEELNAYMAMSHILEKYPEIDLVFAHNDAMAFGAYKAAKEAGREKIKFIGVDALTGENKGVDMVAKGILEATFIYPNGVEEIMETALSILKGNSVPREITLSTAMVDASNVRLMELQETQIQKQHHKLKVINERLGSFTSGYRALQNTLGIIAIALFCVIALTGGLFVLLKKRNCLNRELIFQRDKMKEMAAEIEKSAQAKLMFFTNISHDIRTPLSLISGPVEKLKDPDLTPEKRHSYIELISRNIEILLQLVNQLLDFRKYEQGKMSFSPVKINPIEYLQRWNESFIILLNKKNIDFQFIIRDNTHYMMYADIDKLEKIYFNIISNAFKFTPNEGKITVTVFQEMESDEKKLKIEVLNTGSFIPGNDLDNIFERFYQSDNTNHTSGVGIGLALARVYTDCHNGSITAESDKILGTKFIITLPLLKEFKDFPEHEVIKESENTIIIDDDNYLNDLPKEYSSGKPVILIIDDNKDMTTYLSMLLQDNYSVIATTESTSGLHVAIEQLPDLIISDIMMPVMDGLELVKKLKTSITSCHIPVILLTARNLEEQRVEGYESGADSYITKPFKSEVLLSRVHNLLRSRDVLRKSFEDGMMSINKNACEDEFMNNFKEYLYRHISDNTLSIDDICLAMGASRTQLYRKIKSLTGMSANEYIKIFRLKKSKAILKNSNINISQAGYEVGFNSASYFIKCFKDYFGETPNEYISKLRR